MTGDPAPETETWYVIRQPDGTCSIESELKSAAAADTEADAPSEADKVWGPFGSRPEAIARRVGLIRAGRCQPL